MAFVPDAYNKIHEEQVRFRDPNSRGLLQQLAGAVNKALNEGEITPVGTIVKSMLTEDQFASEAGPGWVLCDGRSVVGSAYEALTLFTVAPDVRGVFTRMKGYGAGGWFDRPLGFHETDGLQIHNHTNTWTHTDGLVANASGGFPTKDVDSGEEKRRTLDLTNGEIYTRYNIALTGGNETRGRNITCNFFIKIN